MKKLLAAVIFFFSIAQVIAQDSGGISSSYSNELDRLTITYNSSSSRKVNISLINEKGKVVLQKKEKAKRFEKHLNVENLVTGKYSLLVEDGLNIHSERYELKPFKQVLVDNITITFDQGKKLLVNIGEEVKSPMDILVFDGNDNLLGFNTIKPRVNPKAVYSFSNHPSPSVKVEVHVGEAIIVKEKISVGETLALR